MKRIEMKKSFWSILVLVVLALPMIAACGSDDDNGVSDAAMIPSGKYIEENGLPKELFSMVVDGHNITITVTVNGIVTDSWKGTYRISGNTITLSFSDGTSETVNFSMSGGKVTIGEITYIRQS